MQKWRFKPGLKDGKAVPVIANIEVNFRLAVASVPHTLAVHSGLRLSYSCRCARPPADPGCWCSIGVLVLLLFFGRSLCSLLIDYKWWGEMGQVNTWQRMWLYRYVPGFAQWLILRWCCGSPTPAE